MLENFRANVLKLKRAQNCGFERPVNRGDSRILKTQWIVDQLFLTRIPDGACLMFRSQVLNKILIIDLFFSLGRNMLMSSSKLFLFSKEAHLN